MRVVTAHRHAFTNHPCLSAGRHAGSAWLLHSQGFWTSSVWVRRIHRILFKQFGDHGRDKVCLAKVMTRVWMSTHHGPIDVSATWAKKAAPSPFSRPSNISRAWSGAIVIRFLHVILVCEILLSFSTCAVFLLCHDESSPHDAICPIVVA